MKITLENLDANTVTMLGRLRWVRATKNLRLNVPSRSICFFVLPDARLPACINGEVETSVLLKQIDDGYVATSSNENTLRITSRSASPKTSLSEIYRSMQLELDEDERFYKRNGHGNVWVSIDNLVDDRREDMKSQYGDSRKVRRGMRGGGGAGDFNSIKRHRDVKIGNVLEANLSEINKRKGNFRQNFGQQLKFYKKTFDYARNETVGNSSNGELENVMLKTIRELLNRKKLYLHSEEQQQSTGMDLSQKSSLSKRLIRKAIYKRESNLENSEDNYNFDGENNSKSSFEANEILQRLSEDFHNVSIGNDTEKVFGKRAPSTTSKYRLISNDSSQYNCSDNYGAETERGTHIPENLEIQVESRHHLNISPKLESALNKKCTKSNLQRNKTKDGTKQISMRRQFPKESKRFTAVNTNNLNEETSQNADVKVKKMLHFEKTVSM